MLVRILGRRVEYGKWLLSTIAEKRNE
jgi:hypothetical protein